MHELSWLRSRIADAFHFKVRGALAAGAAELERTVLAWRATGFICKRGLYGAWLAAEEGTASSLSTPRAKVSGVCEAYLARAWAAFPDPPWGSVSVEEYCAHGNQGPRGGEFTNDLAAETVRHLNACYFAANRTAPLPPGFPCPDDLRGVANRREWRLPGVYFLAYNELTLTTCEHVDHSDGIHVRQVVLPMLRSFLAAVQ